MPELPPPPPLDLSTVQGWHDGSPGGQGPCRTGTAEPQQPANVAVDGRRPAPQEKISPPTSPVHAVLTFPAPCNPQCGHTL